MVDYAETMTQNVLPGGSLEWLAGATENITDVSWVDDDSVQFNLTIPEDEDWDGEVRFSVSGAQDLATNAQAASEAVFTIDTTDPRLDGQIMLNISSVLTDNQILKSDTYELTVTFSEAIDVTGSAADSALWLQTELGNKLEESGTEWQDDGRVWHGYFSVPADESGLVDGIASVYFNLIDDPAGNRLYEDTSSYPFTIDTLAPTISDYRVESNRRILEDGETVTFSWTLSEAAASFSLHLENSEGETVRTLVSNTTGADAGGGAAVWDGRNDAGTILTEKNFYQAVFQMADRAGNNATSQQGLVLVDETDLTVDTPTPSLTYFSPGVAGTVDFYFNAYAETDAVSGTPDAFIGLSPLSISDTQIGYVTASIYDSSFNQVKVVAANQALYQGTGYDTNAVSWNGYDADGNLVADGLYYLALQAERLTGKAAETQPTVSFYVDSTAPSYYSWTSSEYVSQRSRSLYPTWAVGVSFNDTISSEIQYTVTISSEAGYALTLVSATRDAGSYEDIFINTDSQWLDDGYYHAGLSITDEAGNRAQQTAGVTIDNHVPDALIVSPSEGDYRSDTLTLDFSVSDNNLAGYSLYYRVADPDQATTSDWTEMTSGIGTGSHGYSFGTTDTPLGLLNHRVQLWLDASDHAGNQAAEAYTAIYVDNTAPTFSIRINGGDTYCNVAQVNIDMIDVVDQPFGSPNVTYYEVRSHGTDTVLAEGVEVTGSVGVSLIEGIGTNLLWARLVDRAANVTDYAYTKIIYDFRPPDIESVSLDGSTDDDVYTKERNVTLHWQGSDNYELAGAAVWNETDPDTVTTFDATETSLAVTLPDTSFGACEVVLRLLDAAGNTSTASASIILDQAGPAASTWLINSDAGYCTVNTVTLTYAGSDNSGTVSTVNVHNTDGGELSYAYDSLGTIASWTLGSSEEGSHTVYGVMTDPAGNSSATVQDSIFLDYTAPVGTGIASSTHPTEDKWYNVDDVNVKFYFTDYSADGQTGSDVAAGVYQYEWWIEESSGALTGSVQTAAEAGLGYVEGTATDLLSGRYVFKARAIDYAGNWSNIEEFNVRVDTTAPSLYWFGGEGFNSGEWIENNQPTVDWTIIDADAGSSGIIQYALNQNDSYDFDAYGSSTYTQTESYAHFQYPTAIEDGSWYLWLRVSDGTYASDGTWDGQWSNPMAVQINLDTAAPEVTVSTANSELNYARDQSVSICMTVAESNALSAELMVVSGDETMYSETLFSNEDSVAGYTWTWDGERSDGTYLAAGSYSAYVTFTDESGREAIVTQDITVSLTTELSAGSAMSNCQIYKINNTIYLEYTESGSNYQLYSSDGLTWSEPSAISSLRGVTLNFKTDSEACSYNFFYKDSYYLTMRKSNDFGSNWSDEVNIIGLDTFEPMTNSFSDPTERYGSYVYSHIEEVPLFIPETSYHYYYAFSGSVALGGDVYALISRRTYPNSPIYGEYFSDLLLFRIPANYAVADDANFSNVMPYLQLQGTRAMYRQYANDLCTVFELEPTLDINWSNSSVQPTARRYGFEGDTVQVTFDAYLYADRSGTFTFYGVFDDDLAVYIDDVQTQQLVYSGGSVQEWTESLTQGFHHVTFVFNEYSGYAYCRVWWDGGNPASNFSQYLYTEDFPRSGWNAKYNHSVWAVEDQPYTDWGGGAVWPDSAYTDSTGCAADNTNVSWNAYLVLPQAGTYWVRYNVDDNLQIYIDGIQRVGRFGHTEQTFQTSDTFTLSAGTHDVLVLFQEDGGKAYCEINLLDSTFGSDDGGYFKYNCYYHLPSGSEGSATLTTLALSPATVSSDDIDLRSPVGADVGTGKTNFQWAVGSAVTTSARQRLEITDATLGVSFTNPDYRYDLGELSQQGTSSTANLFAYRLADYQSLGEGAWAWRMGVDDLPGDGTDSYDFSGSATFNVTGVAADIENVINYPNPFSVQTTIRYKLSKAASLVKIKIYNAAGRLVRSLDGDTSGTSLMQEYNDVVWDGANGAGESVLNGVYPYEVVATFADGTVKRSRGKAVRLR